MKFSISIVSHNSGELIAELFKDLCKTLPNETEVILTINVPENESYLSEGIYLPLRVIRNISPLGFGANHNQAFASACGEKFIILNPDIRIRGNPWHALDSAFDPDTGACAPLVLSPAGTIEDSVREYPTLGRLFRRVVLRDRSPDYLVPSKHDSVNVAWAAGMFVMFDSESFREIGGFDTRYFMYLEDVDICKRLHTAGKKVLWVPQCSVIHNAQRASGRSWQHLRWHVRSVVRYLFGV